MTVSHLFAGTYKKLLKKSSGGTPVVYMYKRSGRS
jgi:hypothetical protein